MLQDQPRATAVPNQENQGVFGYKCLFEKDLKKPNGFAEDEQSHYKNVPTRYLVYNFVVENVF
jgi:hypothetical protein